MNNIQVLISTMNRFDGEESFLEEMNILTDAIVINQCNLNGEKIFDYKNNAIKWINSQEKGLSKSRNLALASASSEICIIADDDLVYCDDYAITIQNAFNELPEADIIAFQVRGIEREYKKYYPKQRKINYITSMKISSVQIAIKLNRIKDNALFFDEMFGSGAKFCAGEENIFLFACLRKKLNIYYVPKIIANLHIGNSSWFCGFNRKYFHDKGAIFEKLSSFYSLLLIMQFALRKYNLYKKDMPLLKAIKHMLEGRKTYRDFMILEKTD